MTKKALQEQIRSPEKNRLNIIAHRGASYRAPENTLAAVNLAWKLGADVVEVDVHLTRDRKIMVMHDDSTGRTAGFHLIIREAVSSNLRKLDVGAWKSSAYTGEKIPFLEEVLAVIPEGKCLLVEIKSDREIIPVLEKIIEASGKKSRIAVISFSYKVVARMKEVMPNIPVHWLCTYTEHKTLTSFDHEDTVEALLTSGFDGLDIRYRGLTGDVVTTVKSAGLKLYTWTINDLHEALRARELGVDGITTDHPSLLRELLND